MYFPSEPAKLRRQTLVAAAAATAVLACNRAFVGLPAEARTARGRAAADYSRVSAEVTFGRGDRSVCPLGGFTGAKENIISN